MLKQKKRLKASPTFKVTVSKTKQTFIFYIPRQENVTHPLKLLSVTTLNVNK